MRVKVTGASGNSISKRACLVSPTFSTATGILTDSWSDIVSTWTQSKLSIIILKISENGFFKLNLDLDYQNKCIFSAHNLLQVLDTVPVLPPAYQCPINFYMTDSLYKLCSFHIHLVHSNCPDFVNQTLIVAVCNHENSPKNTFKCL